MQLKIASSTVSSPKAYNFEPNYGMNNQSNYNMNLKQRLIKSADLINIKNQIMFHIHNSNDKYPDDIQYWIAAEQEDLLESSIEQLQLIIYVSIKQTEADVTHLSSLLVQTQPCYQLIYY